MGRLHRRAKNYRQKKQKTVVFHEAGQIPAPSSDPEACRTPHIRDDNFSSETNSCFDEYLTYPKTPDEMEVTRKLSCLNFSVIPCSSNTMAVSVNMCSSLVNNGLPLMRDLDISSDLEVCSEIASGTQLELLPTLSDDKDMEDMEICHRYSRKRQSKRKTNRKTKKFHSINARETITSKQYRSPSLGMVPQSIAHSFVRSSSKELPSTSSNFGNNGSTLTPPLLTTPLVCSRSFRRSKRPQHCHEEDPLLRYLSDTSILETEHYIKPGQDMEEVEPMFETPPTGVQCKDIGEDMLAIDSELSDTTTSDSGCEGDDEESGMEGPISMSLTSRHPLLYPHHPSPMPPPPPLHLISWLKHNDDSDPRLNEMLSGTSPLLSVKEQDHTFSEFKHPGGLSGRSGRKKRCKPRELTHPLNILDINQRIILFIQDSSKTADSEIKFTLVSRALCKTIAALANVYHLDCFIEQKRRLPVASPRLRMTQFTRIATREEIEPILRRHGRESPGIALHGKDDTYSRIQNPCKSHSETPIQVVGAGTESMILDETNIGNRMLQGMGWKPGAGLGPEMDGIKSPIQAYVRTKHTGLGFT